MGKITHEIAQRIIDLYVEGRNTHELANLFGLWDTQIGNIVRGKCNRGPCWKACTRPENIEEIIHSRKLASRIQTGWNDSIHAEKPPLTAIQKEVIVGSLLGDGYLKKAKKNNSFNKNQCKAYREYLQWHLEVLSPYALGLHEINSDKELFCDLDGILRRRKTRKRLVGYDFSTCCHPVFTQLRDIWYPQGKKTIPESLTLSPLSIAIWFCDDGCNSASQRTAIFCTESFTFEEADFLCNRLASFDIVPRIITKISKKTGRKQPMLKVSRQSYDNLIYLIKPHVAWECMSHKVNHHPFVPQHLRAPTKLTPKEVLEIVELNKRWTQPRIAEKYGVHKGTISRIVTGALWSHLTGIKREHDV